MAFILARKFLRYNEDKRKLQTQKCSSPKNTQRTIESNSHSYTRRKCPPQKVILIDLGQFYVALMKPSLLSVTIVV